jgi:hypothetical protein
VGFNLYRSDSQTGLRVLLNNQLIPCQSPGSPVGGDYSFEDRLTAPGATYYYWIEEVQLNTTMLHGPVQVAAGQNFGPVIYLPVVIR